MRMKLCNILFPISRTLDGKSFPNLAQGCSGYFLKIFRNSAKKSCRHDYLKRITLTHLKKLFCTIKLQVDIKKKRKKKNKANLNVTSN